MHRTIYTRMWNSICTYLILHLFVTLCSLPILMYWGLTVSILSPLGNLLFSPFITFFLGTSALLFFTELLGIPNAYLAQGMDIITTYWFKLIPTGSMSLHIGLAQPMFWVLALLPILGVLIIKCTSTPNRQLILLVTLLLSTMVFFKVRTYLTMPQRITISYDNRHTLHLIHNEGKLILVDPGVLGGKASESWVQFDLIPEIIKKTGRTSLDYVIVLHLNGKLFESLTALLENFSVQTIAFPVWKGRININAWKKFKALQECIHQKKISCVRLHENKILMNNFEVFDTHCLLKYDTVQYKSLGIRHIIDNQPFTIYASKHRNKKMDAQKI